MKKLAICVVLSLPFGAIVAASFGPSLAERVATLEEYRQQQRDWNREIDHRLTTELSQSQGAQDAHIQALEDQFTSLNGSFNTLRAFGTVGGFILGVGAPIAWSAFSKWQRQAERSHRKLERIFKALGYALPDEDDGEKRSEE